MLRAVGWVFLSGLVLSNRIANRVGRKSEFEADRRAVAMGFGRELATALRRVDAASAPVEALPPATIDSLGVTHPTARSRIVRIDALVRQAATRQRLQR